MQMLTLPDVEGDAKLKELVLAVMDKRRQLEENGEFPTVPFECGDLFNKDSEVFEISKSKKGKNPFKYLKDLFAPSFVDRNEQEPLRWKMLENNENKRTLMKSWMVYLLNTFYKLQCAEPKDPINLKLFDTTKKNVKVLVVLGYVVLNESGTLEINEAGDDKSRLIQVEKSLKLLESNVTSLQREHEELADHVEYTGRRRKVRKGKVEDEELSISSSLKSILSELIDMSVSNSDDSSKHPKNRLQESFRPQRNIKYSEGCKASLEGTKKFRKTERGSKKREAKSNAYNNLLSDMKEFYATVRCCNEVMDMGSYTDNKSISERSNLSAQEQLKILLKENTSAGQPIPQVKEDCCQKENGNCNYFESTLEVEAPFCITARGNSENDAAKVMLQWLRSDQTFRQVNNTSLDDDVSELTGESWTNSSNNITHASSETHGQKKNEYEKRLKEICGQSAELFYEGVESENQNGIFLFSAKVKFERKYQAEGQGKRLKDAEGDASEKLVDKIRSEKFYSRLKKPKKENEAARCQLNDLLIANRSKEPKFCVVGRTESGEFKVSGSVMFCYEITSKKMLPGSSKKEAKAKALEDLLNECESGGRSL